MVRQPTVAPANRIRMIRSTWPPPTNVPILFAHLKNRAKSPLQANRSALSVVQFPKEAEFLSIELSIARYLARESVMRWKGLIRQCNAAPGTTSDLLS